MASTIYDSVTLQNSSSHIRLLRFRSSATYFSEHVDIELSSWPFAQAPPFRAISYRWGPTEPRRCVQINGEDVYVNENCWHALRQARPHSFEQYVWLDAICINQNDTVEKSAQVAMMYDIYSAAFEVFACIGPHDDASRYVCALFIEMPEPDQASGSRRRSENIWLSYLRTQPPQSLQHFETFDQRSYWTRLWIIQELCAGRHSSISVLCGDSLIDWTRLLRLAQFLDGHALLPAYVCHNPFRNLIKLARSVRYSTAGWQFANIVPYLKDWQCQDPRDKIFGVVKIVRWPEGMAPTVDYRKSRAQVASEVIRIMSQTMNYGRDYPWRVGEIYQLLGVYDRTVAEFLNIECTIEDEESLTECSGKCVIAEEALTLTRSYQDEHNLPESFEDDAIMDEINASLLSHNIRRVLCDMRFGGTDRRLSRLSRCLVEAQASTLASNPLLPGTLVNMTMDHLRAET